MNENNFTGPCATACKPRAGTGIQSTAFGSIIVSAQSHASRETGLPGRVDRETTSCRSCGAETTNDRICDACADAMREERAAALGERCRVHRVRHVEDLPISVIEEMQAARGWA